MDKVITQQAFQKRLAAAKKVLPKAPPPVNETRWRYRGAAAVRTVFDPERLRPLTARANRDIAAVFLRQDCVRVLHSDGKRHWQLKYRVRRQTFRWLADQGLLEKAAAAVDDSDPVASLLAKYLRGEAPAGEHQTIDELYASIQIVDWLNGIVPDLPRTAELTSRVEVMALLEPLRNLVGDHFVGREEVLGQLYDYVEVLPPSTSRERVRRTLRRVVSLEKEPPLLLYGPGGVGKSTVVAKFILDHTTPDENLRFPYVYLNFDRPDLVADEPLTLLLEATRQVAAQYPRLSPRAEELQREWISALTSGIRHMSRGEKEIGPGRAVVDVQPQVGRFAELINEVRRSQPLLLVADTFEEVQRRGQTTVDRLWEFLDDLQHEIPRLRVVLAGRAPLRQHETREVYLKDFDDRIAAAYLTRLLADFEPDERFIKRTVQRVGNNPLSLKLAADVIQLEGPDALKDLRTRNRLVFKVREAEVQGQLYRRILDHLEDAELRKIANPGLVLRRITPEIIQEVLAGPCDLSIESQAHPEKLFEHLKREASLVSEAEGGAAVYHRPDVRRAMLGYLTEDDPERVKRIHRAAIAYYKRQNGSNARAEEIYHRLALGQRPTTVDKHWNDSALPFLEGAIDELPPEGRAYLASRLGHEVDEETLVAISEENWKRQAKKQAASLLADDRATKALDLVQRRRRLDGESLLPAVEAQALLAMGDSAKAAAVAERGMARTAEAGDARLHLQLALIVAAVHEQSGEFEDANTLLTDAKAAADETREPIPILEVGVSQLRLLRRMNLRDSEETGAIQQEMLRLLETIPERKLTKHPTLLRDLAAELGTASPAILKHAMRVVGVGDLGEAHDRNLATALEDWDKEVSSARGAEQIIFESARDVPESTPDNTWQDWLGKQDSSVQKGRKLSRLIESYQDTPSNVQDRISDIYQAESDAYHDSYGPEQASWDS